MKRFQIFLIIGLCLTYGYHGLGWAVEDVPVGARPLGMGGAYVGFAADANTLQWNPAGTPRLNRYEVTTTYTNLYHTSINQYYLGMVIPFHSAYGTGLDWSRIATDDDALTYAENMISLNLARRWGKYVSLGINLKYLQQLIEYQEQYNGSGWGIDIGGLYTPSFYWQMGVVVKNVFDTKIHHSDGTTRTILPRNFRAGLAIFPRPDWTVGIDVSDRVHLGVEYQLHPLLKLRTGIQKQHDVNESWIFSAGMGLQISPFQFDYAYQNDPDLDDTHRFAVTFALDKYHSPLNIDIQFDHIFPTNYKRYIYYPVGRVWIQNKSNHAIGLEKVGLKVDHFSLDFAYTDIQQRLQAGERMEIPLFAHFSPDILELEEERITHGTVEISYTEDKLRTISKSDKILIHNYRSIIWDDVRKIVAFISPQSPVVTRFTRTALNQSQERPTYMPENLFQTLRIFDAMSAHEIKYIRDPNYSFPTVYHQNIIDFVQRPSETICLLSGDCDDLVVFMASCLESMGLSTAIADVPGHLFLLVDIGLAITDPYLSTYERQYLIPFQNRLWIPVETTWVGSSFLKAWQKGFEQYKKHDRENTLRLYLTQDAWTHYPSTAISKNTCFVKPAPPLYLSEDLTQFKKEKIESIKKTYYLNRKDRTITPYQHLRWGVGLAEGGFYGEAEAEFKQVIAADSSQVDAYSNLGIVYSLQEQYDLAKKMFQKALQLKDDAVVRINLALTYYELGEYERAKEEYERAIFLDPSLKSTYRFLIEE